MGNHQQQYQLSTLQSDTGQKTSTFQMNNNYSTQNCLHQSFLQQLLFTNRKVVNRKQNPFCPFNMKISKNWMTCCFISPIMALASPLYLFNKDGEFYSQCQILVSNTNKIQSLKVIDAILIIQNQLCLLVIEKPFFKVGWMSISYINTLKQIQENRLKIVNHPEKIYNGKDIIHIQKIKQIELIQQAYKSNNNYIFKNYDIDGSIIIKIQHLVPSIVGIQINQNQALLFNKKIFKEICSKAKNYNCINFNQKHLSQSNNEIYSNQNEIVSQYSLIQ